jgi:hypothetical protein
MKKLNGSIFFVTVGIICSALLMSCSLVKDSGKEDFVMAETIPANGATDVPPGIVITISFSADINASTATNDSVILTDSTGKSVSGLVIVNGIVVKFVPGTVTTDDSGEKIVTPVLLNVPETYHFTITTQVKDIYGRSLANDFTMSFATAAE